jgi:hypothetical protein
MFLQQMKDATPQANHQSDLRHLFAYRPRAMRHLLAFTQAAMPCALGRLGSPRGSRRATGDRERLERVCRSTLRPPVAEERVSRTADGQLR